MGKTVVVSPLMLSISDAVLLRKILPRRRGPMIAHRLIRAFRPLGDYFLTVLANFYGISLVLTSINKYNILDFIWILIAFVLLTALILSTAFILVTGLAFTLRKPILLRSSVECVPFRYYDNERDNF